MKQPALHIPLWHTLTAPQLNPSLRAGWTQVPVLSQASLVQGLLSSAQLMPAAIGWWTGTPLSQTSTVQGLLSSTGTQGAPPAPPMEEAAEVPACPPPAPSRPRSALQAPARSVPASTASHP